MYEERMKVLNLLDKIGKLSHGMIVDTLQASIDRDIKVRDDVLTEIKKHEAELEALLQENDDLNRRLSSVNKE